MDSNTNPEYEQFKSDCESLKLFDFMDKWGKHPKYNKYEMKLFEEDYYEYVCEEYNYDEKNIEEWMIYKDTCELYAKLLADN
jgi:hypothetical protein